uniref:Testis specific gene A13 n=1 Tax=Nannospalax galili TaxID=1026970 RepID=A0A8C6R4Q1_NANGA
MGPKRNAKFSDDSESKTMKNNLFKFERKVGFDGEEVYGTAGQSKFVLKNLWHYTVHPNMARHYEPLKPSKLQKFLAQRNKISSFMVKVAEFDQDMTLLLMTNNPPPYSISQHDKDGAPKYFPQDFQLKETQLQCKPTKNIWLPILPQKKKLRQDLKPVFSMKQIGDLESKEQQWFRFSTDNDFKSEGKYSEVYALRKQKKMYPTFTFDQVCQRESKRSESEKPTSQATWEPLSFSKLLEEKPIKTVPGENAFRHGRAQNWVIKNAAVIK